MTCSVDYPQKPCPFGFEGRSTRNTCGACKHYVPPPHILSWCMLYDQTKQVCKLPKSACTDCKFKHERSPGRPKTEGEFDWSDPDGVRAYHAKYAAEHRDAAKARLDKFLEKNPTYWKDYYEQNKDKILERQRKRYQDQKLKKNKGNAP